MSIPLCHWHAGIIELMGMEFTFRFGPRLFYFHYASSHNVVVQLSCQSFSWNLNLQTLSLLDLCEKEGIWAVGEVVALWASSKYQSSLYVLWMVVGNVVYLSARCYWFCFPYPGWKQGPVTWKVPSNKLWACQCTALCLWSSRTKPILDRLRVGVCMFCYLSTCLSRVGIPGQNGSPKDGCLSV